MNDETANFGAGHAQQQQSMMSNYEISYHPGMSLRSRSTHRTSSIIVSSKEIPASPQYYQNIKNNSPNFSMPYDSENDNNNNNSNHNNNTKHYQKQTRNMYEPESKKGKEKQARHTPKPKPKPKPKLKHEIQANNEMKTNTNNTTINVSITKANLKTIDQIEHGKLVPHNHNYVNSNNNNNSNNHTSSYHCNSVNNSIASIGSVGSDVSNLSNWSEISKMLHPSNKYATSYFKPPPHSMSSHLSTTSCAATVDELDTLPNMDELHNYDRHKELGNGTDAHVYEVVDRRDKSHVAMKLTKRKSGRYRTEIHLLHQLRTCPYVVKLLKVLEDASVYVLILEQAPMTLELLLHERCTDTPMQERIAKEIMIDVLKGCNAIHCLGFLHKDLKPENVLIFADRKNRKLQAKIADFGFATRAQYRSTSNKSGDDNKMDGSFESHTTVPNETLSEFMERVSDRCGTPGFWAPELVAGCVTLSNAFKMDVFSGGVTLYRMLCNEMPFGLFESWETKTTEDGRIKLNKMKPNFQVVSWIKTQNMNEIDINTKQPKIDYIRKQSKQELSKTVETLLRGMLRIRPYRRFTIEDCLAHEWLKI